MRYRRSQARGARFFTVNLADRSTALLIERQHTGLQLPNVFVKTH